MTKKAAIIVAATFTVRCSMAFVMTRPTSSNNYHHVDLQKVQLKSKLNYQYDKQEDDIAKLSRLPILDQSSSSSSSSSSSFISDHILTPMLNNESNEAQFLGATTQHKRLEDSELEEILLPEVRSSLDSTTLQRFRFVNRHSAKDYLYNLSTLPQSSVLAEIRNPVLCVTIWSMFLSVVHRALQEFGYARLADHMCMSHGPHSLVAKVLGLLLVFKTNSAYGRFQEGRQIWEQIHSQSRDLSRMLNLYQDCIGTSRKLRMEKLLVSFPYLLRHHVCPRCLTEETVQNSNPDDLIIIQDEIAPCDTRYDNSISSQRSSMLNAALDYLTAKTNQSSSPSSRTSSSVTSTDDSLDAVQCRSCVVDKRMLPWRLLSDGVAVTKKSFNNCVKSRNRPLWICDRLASEIMSIPVAASGMFTPRERMALLGHVNKLSNTIGQCEKLHQTLVPVNYARHCLRSLTIWLMSLPLTLLKDFGLKTGLLMSIMAWLMFGVYQIGYTIEDPFQGSIRLSILCDNIRRDVFGDTYSRDTAFKFDERD